MNRVFQVAKTLSLLATEPFDVCFIPWNVQTSLPIILIIKFSSTFKKQIKKHYLFRFLLTVFATLGINLLKMEQRQKDSKLKKSICIILIGVSTVYLVSKM